MDAEMKVIELRTWSKMDLIDKAEIGFLEAASSILNDSHREFFNFTPFEQTFTFKSSLLAISTWYNGGS